MSKKIPKSDRGAWFKHLKSKNRTLPCNVNEYRLMKRRPPLDYDLPLNTGTWLDELTKDDLLSSHTPSPDRICQIAASIRDAGFVNDRGDQQSPWTVSEHARRMNGAMDYTNPVQHLTANCFHNGNLVDSTVTSQQP